MSHVVGQFKVVRVVPTGTGSKRITIPKEIVDNVVGDSQYVKVAQQDNHIIVEPLELGTVTRSRKT